MSDILKEASSTFNELVRMHELNQELLETLMVAMQWIREYARKNNIPLLNQNTFFSLLNKAETLINEIMSNSPPFLQRQIPSDESKQPHKPDEEVTGPKNGVTKLQVTNFHMENKINKVTKTSQNRLKGWTHL